MAVKTALAFATDRDPAGTYEGNERAPGEIEEASLARCYPDFEALTADGRFLTLAQTLYAPLVAWIGTHVDATAHAEPTGVTQEAA